MSTRPPHLPGHRQNHDSMANENGSILLVALLIMVALSFFAVMSLNSTDFKLKLSGNDKNITRLKTRAEATVAFAAEMVESLPGSTLKNTDWNASSRPGWLSRGRDNQYDVPSELDKYQKINTYAWDLSNWIYDGSDPHNAAVLEPEQDFDSGESFAGKFPSCMYQVIDVEVSEGSSLQTGNRLKNMHNLYIIGASTQGQGKRMLQIGYRKEY